MTPPKPPIQIVDYNDRLIGHKLRHEVDYAADTYRSSCVWIENSRRQVLLAQRKWTKDKDPGLWGPAAAGTVDEGETYESNAYKELEEELGITGVKLQPVQKIRESSPRQQFIQCFKGYADWPLERVVLQADEVEQAAWVNHQDLLNDLEKHPQKYVPSMSKLLKLFIQDS